MVVDVVPRRGPRVGMRVGRKPVVVGVLLFGCLVAVLVFTLRAAPLAGTPIRAVDLYVSAREQGDRGAMAKILGGNAALSVIKLSEVDGHPVDVTGVTITRSDISNVLYDVTVTWTDASHRVSTDKLMVLPRQGGDPGASLDWCVSAAS